MDEVSCRGVKPTEEVVRCVKLGHDYSHADINEGWEYVVHTTLLSADSVRSYI